MNELEKRLIESPSLPTLPAVAQRILELLQDENADLSRIASAISCDAALTAKVLRLINSPLYGLSREIVSLREAVLYLGMNSVRSVALSFSFISSLRAVESSETLDSLWRCSLMNALAARRLATEVGGWDPEEAFLAGLVADCGALVLFNLLPEYRPVVKRFLEGESDLLDLERATIETDHTRVASLLLEGWNFPDHFRLVVARHHEPSELPQGSREELQARILTASWLCARALSVRGFACETASLDQHVSTLLGISPSVAAAVVAELPDELREMAGFFRIPADQQKSYDALLGQANEQLSELAISTEYSANRAIAAAEAELSEFLSLRCELSDQLTVDPATQLLSRPSFEVLLDAFHRRARQTHTSLGLLVIELEDLKQVESEAGSSAAEELLSELRERIAGRMRNTDQLARFGQGQLAALAPGCALDALRHAADRVLDAIESVDVDLGSGPVRMRASIGIAASAPDRDGLDPRALLSLAGSALDQARASGESIACTQ